MYFYVIELVLSMKKQIQYPHICNKKVYHLLCKNLVSFLLYENFSGAMWYSLSLDYKVITIEMFDVCFGAVQSINLRAIDLLNAQVLHIAWLQNKSSK